MCKLLVWNHAKKIMLFHAEDAVVVRSMRFFSASTVHTAAEQRAAFLPFCTTVEFFPFKSKSLLCFLTRVVAVATKLVVAELTAEAVEVTRSPLPLSFSASGLGLCRWWWVWGCLLLPNHAMVIYHWDEGVLLKHIDKVYNPGILTTEYR